jgi:amidase
LPKRKRIPSSAVSTFITRFDDPDPACSESSTIRLAVKDLIDMEGVVTTAGCRAVLETSQPAERDATCLRGAREAGVRIVGRTNLHELALGVTGVNPWFGTPVNPLDPTRIPGGSSSGSAVAVATNEADVAFGTDTGGSVRIPSACCGTAGLKTTWGRIPVEGIRPLAPSFDTVGPMARDVAGLVTGMRLLEPGFEAAGSSPARVGVLRIDCDPVVAHACDAALDSTGWQLVELSTEGWDEANTGCGLLLVAEAWASNRALAESYPERIGRDVLERLHLGRDVDRATLLSARQARVLWQRRLDELFAQVELLATPTLTILPPALGNGPDLLVARCTLPVNLAGAPALSLPVPTSGHLPASLQLIAPARGEEQLLAAGAFLEQSLAAGRR